MSDRQDHHQALQALYLSSASGAWVRPNLDLESGVCSVSVRLTPEASTPWGPVKDTVIFQLLLDSAALAANTQETSLLVKCDKFEFSPFQPLHECRVASVSRVSHFSLHRWTVESTLYDDAEKEISWGRSWFSRSDVLLKTIAPYKNQFLKLRQDWSK
ncbi:hypothetical protein DIT71_07800 [Marinobacter vulgaris]|uniref:Thioesterase n=1 Tax=Marinobacter vulgaris TaxID=1928331 RepID=A0A2V3ZLX1_9GAMM|nr:hypothetical protein [Marinobacter vulgaris]PXX91759.1 hypothetical protein DIT71_07800 [Marinobacter vulgaris]TSJ70734.1 hypothetical protein FPC41_07570 [Marinobacter vulgaris]